MIAGEECLKTPIFSDFKIGAQDHTQLVFRANAHRGMRCHSTAGGLATLIFLLVHDFDRKSGLAMCSLDTNTVN